MSLESFVTIASKLVFRTKGLPKIISFINSFAWELFWLTQSYGESKYMKTPIRRLRGSERATLNEKLLSCSKLGSILEIGCGLGQNYHVIHQIIPNSKYVGIDISQKCIKTAKELSTSKNLNNATFYCQDAADLSIFANSSFETSYSCASLLFVNEDKIKQVLSELCRVTKNNIILVEQGITDEEYQFFSKIRAKDMQKYWVRNYIYLLKQIVPEASISFKKIPKPIWQGEEWANYGMVITVKLN